MIEVQCRLAVSINIYFHFFLIISYKFKNVSPSSLTRSVLVLIVLTLKSKFELIFNRLENSQYLACGRHIPIQTHMTCINVSNNKCNIT